MGYVDRLTINHVIYSPYAFWDIAAAALEHKINIEKSIQLGPD